jgi:hypothetical protein
MQSQRFHAALKSHPGLFLRVLDGATNQTFEAIVTMAALADSVKATVVEGPTHIERVPPPYPFIAHIPS